MVLYANIIFKAKHFVHFAKIHNSQFPELEEFFPRKSFTTNDAIDRLSFSVSLIKHNLLCLDEYSFLR